MGADEILGDCAAFFADLRGRLEETGIPVEGLPVSHLCYRTATAEEYAAVRDRLKALCSGHAEREFNGRLISMLLLETPIPLGGGFSAPLIELPSPKEVKPYPSGLEHVGLVVGAELAEFHERHRGVLHGRKDRGGAGEASFIVFGNGKTVKFYRRPLWEVVQLDGWVFQPV